MLLQVITTVDAAVPVEVAAMFKLVGFERPETRTGQCRRISPKRISDKAGHVTPQGKKWKQLHFVCHRPKHHTGFHACVGKKSGHLYAVWPSRDRQNA